MLRIFDRLPHIDLSCEMEDRFRSERMEDGIHPFRITDIPFTDHKAGIIAINMQILVRTSGEIVDDADRMAGIDTGIYEV
jgi:hypothetical protein